MTTGEGHNKIAIAENDRGVCYVATGFTEKEARENCITAVCRGEKIHKNKYNTSGFSISIVEPIKKVCCGG